MDPKYLTLIILCSFTLYVVFAVDRNNFKTCEQSGFCKRCRNVSRKKFDFVLLDDTISLEENAIRGIVINQITNMRYFFLLEPLVDNTFRLRINEEKTGRHRFQPIQALISEPVRSKIELVKKDAVQIVFKSSEYIKLILDIEPFKLKLYVNDTLVISANDFGKFVFEHQRTKPVPSENDNENTENNVIEEGEWEEHFKEHQDSKPYGPMAVAMDFSFTSATHAYGIPSHADSLSLKSTVNGQPYRLYNLDVFEYELYNPMALYGSVPVVVAHGVNITVGVFWMNSAETWVDINKDARETSTVMESIVNFVSGNGKNDYVNAGVNAHFMSETGIIDVFFMLGPNFYDVSRQYCRLTGTASLPPLFALGYHQSRWNYFERDVREISEKFDKYDIPVDAIWLDIEYTDAKKYFTWDLTQFPSPLEMQHNLTAEGRKLVVIIDPHIKRDNSYFLHNEATSKGLYVKTKDGNDYEGWCWPGSSGYLDFLNPDATSYYASMYLLENFPYSTEDMYIWNDMNEPSVFNGPEVTMPKDCVHHGDIEHREIHNINGFLQLMFTHAALIKRSNIMKRPFTLSRAHFAGSQRFGAIWTGDNMAEWSHLKISIPMCLSSALAGISFCGADVGGFFKNPDSQLFIRWYQAGSYLPFFRAHSHIDTTRREPWVFNEGTTHLIRKAIRERYALLPFWYTLFYEHTQTGSPIIRPLFAEFPKEKETFDIDNEFLLGDSLLVCPVTEPDILTMNVYFPGHDEIWYDSETYRAVKYNGVMSVDTSVSNIPVFIRGGSIIPRKNRVRRSSPTMLNDPYTLIVALGRNGAAIGHLFIDDGESFEYHRKNYIYLQLGFTNNQLSSRIVGDGRFATKSWLEKVIILGIPNVFTNAIIRSEDGDVHNQLNVIYNANQETLTIRKPGVNMSKNWLIMLN